jgi:hypothetical protein
MEKSRSIKLSPRTTRKKKKSRRRPRTLAQTIERGIKTGYDKAADIGRHSMELSFIFTMLFLVFLLIFGIVILSLPVSAFMDEPSPHLEKFKKITGGVLVGFSCLAILFLIIFRRSIKDSKSFHALKGANILLRSPFRGKP